MSKSGGVIKAFGTVGGWTLISRILGFVRDKMFAQFVGTSAVSDAFFTAFRIPNLFRRFLAEGAFNSAFVPMFSKRATSKGEAQEFAQNSFAGLMFIALLLIALVQIATPLFVLLLASGFVDTPKFDMAVDYSRITIFYILFMSLSALCSGILNSYNKYATAAAAPVLLNVVFIVGFILIWLLGIQNIGIFMSYAVLLGGAMQLGLLMWAVKQEGISLKPSLPKWNMDMKQLVMVALPATLTASVVQINLIVGSQIASGTDRAISWLYYADRVYQLPLGMIGVAVGVVLLPKLSALLRDEDVQGGKDQFNQAVVFSMLITLPSAAAIFALSLPILRTVFEGGQFTALDSRMTASALSIYGLGLPAFVMIKLLQPIFFAREDTKTPARHALFNVVFHAIIAFTLLSYFGFLAAAWASVGAAYAMVIGLWWSARKLDGAAGLTPASIKQLVQFATISVVMAVITWWVCDYFYFIFDHHLWKWPFLALVVVAGMGIYFAGVMTIAQVRPRDIKAMLRN